MMRDIKFRALTALGDWLYGMPLSVTWYGQESYYIVDSLCGDFSLDMHEAVKPETISQFTGLTDKNGVDIYEGDIVYLAGYGDYEVEFPFLELYEAVMENDIGDIKGNIHQNPELIHN